MVSDDPTAPQPLDAKFGPPPFGNFLGFENRECGEHRTVGSHRAWCFDCHEWCYPTDPCKGCELPHLRAEVDRLTADLAQRPVIYARTCDDCPGGTDWQQRAEQAEADLAHTTSQRDAADLCIDAAHEALVEKAWALDIDSLRAIVTEGLSAGRGRSRLHRQLDELRIARAAQPQEGT